MGYSELSCLSPAIRRLRRIPSKITMSTTTLEVTNALRRGTRYRVPTGSKFDTSTHDKNELALLLRLWTLLDGHLVETRESSELSRGTMSGRQASILSPIRPHSSSITRCTAHLQQSDPARSNIWQGPLRGTLDAIIASFSFKNRIIMVER